MQIPEFDLSQYQSVWAQATELSRDTSSDVVYALKDYTIVTVSGAKAFEFLQGQCTCDIERLKNNDWLLGAHCDPKGRVLFSFVAAYLNNHSIGLRVHCSVAGLALATLHKYGMFSRVVCEAGQYLPIALPTNSLAQISLASHGVCTVASVDDEPAMVTLHYRWPGANDQAHNWREIWVPVKSSDQIFAHTKLEGCDSWQSSAILAGISHIQAQTSGNYSPQAINYDLVDGVSFKKGCYTGQEIVARLHYKGQSKQRTHVFEVFQGECPTVGEPLVDATGRAVGQVLDFSEYNGRKLVLACSSLYDHRASEIHWRNNPSPQLQPVALPYAIPNRTD
jgi:tRNA-modifying protein YgfZ